MCACVCVYFVCHSKAAKRFQLQPCRKDALFEDLGASALLQIRGLKLMAATDQRTEMLVRQSLSFPPFFSSTFFFYSL